MTVAYFNTAGEGSGAGRRADYRRMYPNHPALVTRRGRWIRALVPPAARSAVRAMRERLRPSYEYVPQGWARAHEAPQVRGWNTAAVIDGSLKTWPAFVEAVSGTEPLAAFHEVADAEDVSTEDLGVHNLAMSYGYAVGLAARGRERISVLDWGGGLGHYYLLARALLPDTVLDYHLPRHARDSRRRLATPPSGRVSLRRPMP